MSWSKNRKLLYAAIVIILLIGVIGLPAFFIFYKAPTCFDGKQNQSEQGIDCGGSCEKLCPSAFQDAIVSWTRFEQILPGYYNVAAYVINPNTSGGAKNVPYHMVLYDKKGMYITEVKSVMTLPPHRNTLAFQTQVATEKAIPARALFEFMTGAPQGGQGIQWVKQADTLGPLSITDKKYLEDSTGSSLAVTIQNGSVNPIDNISVYAVLYDKDGNAIGFSRTQIDEIPANGSVVAPFTWPSNRNGAVISIEVLPVAE